MCPGLTGPKSGRWLGHVLVRGGSPLSSGCGSFTYRTAWPGHTCVFVHAQQDVRQEAIVLLFFRESGREIASVYDAVSQNTALKAFVVGEFAKSLPSVPYGSKMCVLQFKDRFQCQSQHLACHKTGCPDRRR